VRAYGKVPAHLRGGAGRPRPRRRCTRRRGRRCAPEGAAHLEGACAPVWREPV